MKRRYALSLLSLIFLPACVLEEEGWKARTCEEKIPSPLQSYRVTDHEDAFYAFRNALVSAGYELEVQDIQAGYLRGRIFEDQCQPPDAWSGSESSCDSRWPLERQAEATVSIDPRGVGVVTVRVNLKNDYLFEDGRVESDLCGEDVNALYEDADSDPRLERL